MSKQSFVVRIIELGCFVIDELNAIGPEVPVIYETMDIGMIVRWNVHGQSQQLIIN